MIILASGSPRRRELLSLIETDFEVITSDADETPLETSPDKIVEELSLRKAKDVFDKINGRNILKGDRLLIIAADTLVFIDDVRMGKPTSHEDAVKMLESLSGNVHEVYTGVTLILWKAGETVITSFSEKTSVEFDKLTRQEIEGYVSTGEPMDKAGAYAIQGKSAKFVKSITGDYHNVVGLPVARLYKEMKNIGYY